MRRAMRIALLAVGVLAGCAGGGGEDGGGRRAGRSCTPSLDPVVAPQLGANIQPIWNRSCAVAGCHSTVAPAEGLDLSPGNAFAATVNRRARQRPGQIVVPGDPEASYLVQKIRGDPGIGGVLMPQGCPGNPLRGAQCLTPDEIVAVIDWINACAPDN